MNKNKISRKLLAVLMALCVIFAYTGFAFAGTEGEETTTPETGTEVTEAVVEDEPVEGTEEPVVEEPTEEEPAPVEVVAPKAKKAAKKAKSSLSLLSDGGDDSFSIKSVEFDKAITMNDVYYQDEIWTWYCLQKDCNYPTFESDDMSTDQVPTKFKVGELTDDQKATLKKLMFAAYPCNCNGIFSEKDIEEGIDVRALGHVVWEYGKRWDPDNNTGHIAYENVSEDVINSDKPFWDAVKALIDFADSDVTITSPTITFSSKSAILKEQENGSWRSDAISINTVAGYNLKYTVTVPEGLNLVGEDGKTITGTVVAGEKFYIECSNSADLPADASVTATTTVLYPDDIVYLVTDTVRSGKKEQDIVLMKAKEYNPSCALEVKIETEEKDPEEKDPTNPDTPSGGGTTPGGPTPPAIGPTPTPSLPTVTPDGDGTDTPATPEDPSDDEVDSDALGNGGAATVDDDGDDSIDGDPMGDPDAIDDEEDVDADALGVKTGDASDMIPWTVGFTAALLGLFVALKVRRREN